MTEQKAKLENISYFACQFQSCKWLSVLRAVYMGGGTGFKQDLAMHVYIYISLICPIPNLSHSVYMERILLGRISARPGKAGSRFAQSGSQLKWDNFYHINTPSRFVRTILCWLYKIVPGEIIAGRNILM